MLKLPTPNLSVYLWCDKNFIDLVNKSFNHNENVPNPTYLKNILRPIRFYNQEKIKKVKSINKKRTPSTKKPKSKPKKVVIESSLKKKIDLEEKIRKLNLLCRKKNFSENLEHSANISTPKKERVINMKIKKLDKPRDEIKKSLKAIDKTNPNSKNKDKSK